MDVEYGIGRIPLDKERLQFLALQSRSAGTGSFEKGRKIERLGRRGVYV